VLFRWPLSVFKDLLQPSLFKIDKNFGGNGEDDEWGSVEAVISVF